MLTPGDGHDVNDGGHGVDEYVVPTAADFEDDVFNDPDQDISSTQNPGGSVSNHAPVIIPVDDLEVDASTPISLQIVSTDADQHSLTFTLEGSPPDGATLSPSGLFSWTPTHNQADAAYAIRVKVTDNGTPALSARMTFSIDVMRVGPEIPRQLQVSDRHPFRCH